MVHSKLQTIRFAGTGWDNTGTHPGQIAIYLLKKIFHSILAVSELPTAWQETKVLFIPKVGKATHTTAKDFRPISLKSFKRMISLHIRATIDLKRLCQQLFSKLSR